MYSCCIFDLDGTLVNSIYAINHSVNLTLQEFGYASIDEAHTKKFVGDGYRLLIQRVLLFRGDVELVHYDAACKRYMELFKDNSMYRMEVYEGIRELLACIKEKDMKMAVLSNKPHERTLENVEDVFGKGYFDMIIGEKEDVVCKPDPSGAFYIAETLGVKPSECLYLGDTDTDMMTGRNAGMDTVGVIWGFRDREELTSYAPKYLAETPADVEAIL